MRAIPIDAKAKIELWLGSHVLLHYWEQDNTFFYVARSGESLYFLRLFQLGSDWMISQDAQHNLD